MVKCCRRVGDSVKMVALMLICALETERKLASVTQTNVSFRAMLLLISILSFHIILKFYSRVFDLNNLI